jgi:hypothetical protein
MNKLSSVYHAGAGVRTLKELARSYLTISKDTARIVSRVKVIYRSWGIPCVGKQVYTQRHRAEWLAKINEVSGVTIPKRNNSDSLPRKLSEPKMF